jgi:hypothetical protein
LFIFRDIHHVIIAPRAHIKMLLTLQRLVMIAPSAHIPIWMIRRRLSLVEAADLGNITTIWASLIVSTVCLGKYLLVLLPQLQTVLTATREDLVPDLGVSTVPLVLLVQRNHLQPRQVVSSVEREDMLMFQVAHVTLMK